MDILSYKLSKQYTDKAVKELDVEVSTNFAPVLSTIFFNTLTCDLQMPQ